MNRSYIAISALLFAIAGSASAMPTVNVTAPVQSANSGEGYQGNVSFASTTTRAQVQQELRDAQQRGEIYAGESYPGPFPAAPATSRAAVRAELAAYRAAHPDVSDDGSFIR